MKMRGMRFAANGGIMPVEMHGPMDYESWRECYVVFRTGAIMLEEMSPSRLDNYEKLVRRYSERYGKQCWPIIYQADVRARLEQVERIRRRGQEAYDNARRAGLTHSFDPAKPEWCYDELIHDVNFWTKEVAEPCLLYLAKGAQLSQLVENDAPIDKSSGSTPTAPSPPRRQIDIPDRPAKRQRGPDVREHRLDGLFTHNRRGVELCRMFQSGECTEKDARGNCGRNPSRRHQCAKCLSDRHGADKCSGDAPSSPKPSKGPVKREQGKVTADEPWRA